MLRKNLIPAAVYWTKTGGPRLQAFRRSANPSLPVVVQNIPSEQWMLFVTIIQQVLAATWPSYDCLEDRGSKVLRELATSYQPTLRHVPEEYNLHSPIYFMFQFYPKHGLQCHKLVDMYKFYSVLFRVSHWPYWFELTSAAESLRQRHCFEHTVSHTVTLPLTLTRFRTLSHSHTPLHTITHSHPLQHTLAHYRTLTHSQSHSLSHTFSLSHILTDYRTLSLPHTLAYYRTLSLTSTLSHTLPHSHTISHTLSHSHALSHTITHPLTLTHHRTLSLTLTHYHTLSHALTHSTQLSHIIAHSLTLSL